MILLPTSNKNNSKRIGLIGIYHESNTFIDQVTTMQNFKEGHLIFGKDILTEYKPSYHEIGGIIEGLNQPEFELVPIMYASATPGGIIDKKTSDKLISLLVEKLETALPLDGLMVVPHGAAVSEINDDFDGYWLSLVRDFLGEIPIIGTLDPHANISAKMISAVDAFIAYKTNPHIDQREVGKQAALMMIDTLNNKVKPLQNLLPSKIAISIEQQYTASEPCLSLYQLADKLSQKEDLISMSILLGFPYADVKDMGSAFLVVTNNNQDLSERILEKLEQYLQKNQANFVGEKISIQEALHITDKASKPVLLLDMGDNVGGGSPGDSTFLLHALEAKQNYKSFICIYDPESVKILTKYSPNDIVELTIGAKTDQNHGSPLITNVLLKKIVDGKFQESKPRHGGQTHYNMGPTAIVETFKGTTIMLSSLRIVPFSLEQLLHFNITPSDFDVVVAKGVQAPITAYQSHCPTIIRVNTPGSTTADMLKLIYKKRRKPLFPFEKITTHD